MSLDPQWCPPLGRAVGGQRPSKTGLGGAEPRPASPGLFWGPSPPYLEQHSALFQEAKAATGVGVQSGQAGRVGAGGASTSTVNYEVDPEGSAGSCQGIRTFF